MQEHQTNAIAESSSPIHAYWHPPKECVSRSADVLRLVVFPPEISWFTPAIMLAVVVQIKTFLNAA